MQDFDSIRDACLRDGRLFEDPDFPAEDSSIFFSKRPPKPFEWKRPHVSHPLKVFVYVLITVNILFYESILQFFLTVDLIALIFDVI